jgi:hypothetical protein
MPKLQIVCVTCGFIGFVDSLAQADDSGWKPAPGGPPSELECPACRIDRIEAERAAAPLKQAAGRPGNGPSRP